MKIEEIDGIVCIDGIPVRAHFAAFGAKPDRVAIIQQKAPKMCINGLLIALASGSMTAGEDAYYAYKPSAYKSANLAAELTGIAPIDVMSLELGWSDFEHDNRRKSGLNEEFLRLGALAYKQCTGKD